MKAYLQQLVGDAPDDLAGRHVAREYLQGAHPEQPATPRRAPIPDSPR
jgi:hypothetical protein